MIAEAPEFFVPPVLDVSAFTDADLRRVAPELAKLAGQLVASNLALAQAFGDGRDWREPAALLAFADDFQRWTYRNSAVMEAFERRVMATADAPHREH